MSTTGTNKLVIFTLIKKNDTSNRKVCLIRILITRHDEIAWPIVENTISILYDHHIQFYKNCLSVILTFTLRWFDGVHQDITINGSVT
jgi:hypothetical protein